MDTVISIPYSQFIQRLHDFVVPSKLARPEAFSTARERLYDLFCDVFMTFAYAFSNNAYMPDP